MIINDKAIEDIGRKRQNRQSSVSFIKATAKISGRYTPEFLAFRTDVLETQNSDEHLENVIRRHGKMKFTTRTSSREASAEISNKSNAYRKGEANMYRRMPRFDDIPTKVETEIPATVTRDEPIPVPVDMPVQALPAPPEPTEEKITPPDAFVNEEIDSSLITPEILAMTEKKAQEAAAKKINYQDRFSSTNSAIPDICRSDGKGWEFDK